MKPPLFAPFVILIVLTTTGYLVGGHSASLGGVALLIILCAAGIKFGLVAWYFMELRKVSRLWTFGMLVLLIGVLGLVAILQSRALELAAT